MPGFLVFDVGFSFLDLWARAISAANCNRSSMVLVQLPLDITNVHPYLTYSPSLPHTIYQRCAHAILKRVWSGLKYSSL